MATARILFTAAEAAPIAKVGGMADVVGTLPPVLQQLGLDIRIIMPFYATLRDRVEASRVPIWSGSVNLQPFYVYESTLPRTEVPLYLVAHPFFSMEQVYMGDSDAFRFTFFAQAVIRFAQNYWTPNVIHCHDWHTGLIPALVQSIPDMGSVFTIHNLAYQGPSRDRLAQITTLPKNYQAVNVMAGGILYADQVNTVSPTYANEIQTPVHGAGLEALLQAKGDQLRGILNGIDYTMFNPAKDPAIAQPFTAETLDQRLLNKDALQREAGLEVDRNRFVIGMVSRLVEQKGIDLMVDIMDPFLAYTDVQVVVLGSGERNYEDQLRTLSTRYPDRLIFLQKFDPKLAQRIYAGSDAFLMPSRFEPCGISQMIALCYGSVPIVRRTGGLVDTVIHHNPREGTGTGYCFDRYEGMDLFTCMVRAWEAYQHLTSWKALQQRGMAVDLSWTRSALDYIRMYEDVMGSKLELGDHAVKIK